MPKKSDPSLQISDSESTMSSPVKTVTTSKNFNTSGKNQKSIEHSPAKGGISTPKPNKIKRCVIKEKLLKSPTKQPFTGFTHSRIFTSKLTFGVARAFALKGALPGRLGRENEPAFTKPIEQEILSNESLREELDVHFVMNRRKGPSNNDFLETQLKFPVKQFITIFEDADDNTLENRKKWGEKLAVKFTELAQSDRFRYKDTFKYEGDLASKINEEEPVGIHLQDQDVVHLLKQMFPPTQEAFTSLMEDNDFMDNLYGEENKMYANHVMTDAVRWMH